MAACLTDPHLIFLPVPGTSKKRPTSLAGRWGASCCPDPFGVTLADMPAYLRCPLTGEPVSPDFLRNGDAEAARAGSELLIVDTWMADAATFPPRQGIGWPPATVDVTSREWVAMKLRILEKAFLAGCRQLSGPRL